METASMTSSATVIEPTGTHSSNTITVSEHFAAAIYRIDLDRISAEQRAKATNRLVEDRFGHGPNFREWGINE